MNKIFNIFFMFLLSACNYSHDKVPVDNPPVNPVKYSYAMVNEQVIITNCLKCHSAIGGNQGDINF